MIAAKNLKKNPHNILILISLALYFSGSVNWTEVFKKNIFLNPKKKP